MCWHACAGPSPRHETTADPVAAVKRVIAGVRWLVRLEIGIWRSLALWSTRRVHGRGPGVQELSYAKEVTPLMAAFICVSLVELPVVHVLLAWDTVRLVADVLSIWGLLWMVGMLASLRVFPHLLDDAGIRIRYGTSIDVRIPWDAVERVKAGRHRIPTGKTMSIERDDDEAVMSIAVLKQTRVDVVLREPTMVKLRDGVEQLTELRLYADDPRAFVAAARAKLAERLAS